MNNYESKVEEMRKELRKFESVASILDKIEDSMKWDCMKRIEDDSEEGYHWEEPKEDDWYYDKYIAYKEVLSVLEKTFFPTSKK